MTTIMISVAAFVGVSALVGAVAMMFRSPGEVSIEDRLDVLTGSANVRGVAAADSNVLSQPLDEVPNAVEEYVARFLNVRQFLQQADLAISPAKFIAVSLCVGAVGFIAMLFTSLHVGFAPLVGFVMSGLPLMIVAFKRKARKARFGKQLPEALELVSRALRAGHSLGSGFQLVASEMPDPIGVEFSRVFEEQNLGVALEDALESMCDRVPNVDLRFFATAVILQRQTGGDLAEILDKIGSLIRDRFRIHGQIQALTGEGRLSGIVLMALPPGLFLVMLKLNPDYVMMLFEDPLGQKMMAVAVVMQLLGALVIKKIVNIKV